MKSIALRALPSLAAILMLIVAAGFAFAQSAGAPGDDCEFFRRPGMMLGSSYGGFGMFLGFAFMILMLIATVVLVVVIMRLLGFAGIAGGSALMHPNSITGLDILMQRFARGELNAKEFEDRRRLLVE